MSKINRLDIKQLRIFHALMQEKNASRVADRIGLTQQAVSDQLKKMREIFADELFMRKSNGLIPTTTAVRLGKRIELILADIDNLLEPECFDPALLEGTYTIAASDYAQQVVLPELLATIRSQAPNLRIVIQDFSHELLSLQLAEGRINLLIGDADSVPENYIRRTLFTDNYVCVAHNESALHNKSVDLADIAAQPHLLATSDKAHKLTAIDHWFQRHNLSRNTVMTAPCFTVIPQYLKTMDLLAFVPQKVAEAYQLSVLNIKETPVNFDVVAAWHPRLEVDELQRWIKTLL